MRCAADFVLPACLCAFALPADHDTLEHLGTAAIALDHLEVERAQLDRDWQDERERLRASFQEEQRVRLQELEAGWQEERIRLEQQRENLARERDRAIEEVRAIVKPSPLANIRCFG